MAKKQTAEEKNYKVIAENRRARYDYAIEDDIECGIQLAGSEVKSPARRPIQYRGKLCLH